MIGTPGGERRARLYERVTRLDLRRRTAHTVDLFERASAARGGPPNAFRRDGQTHGA